MKFVLLTGTLLMFQFSATSQKKIKMGDFDEKYIEMNQCPIDSSAEAFYILDYGRTSFDHDFRPTMTRHVILKILTPEAYNRANVKVPYSSSSRIQNFKAVTYNLSDGKVKESELKKRDAIIEDVNDDVSRFNFTLPNVKEGSIIEYTYEVRLGNFVSLNPWYFQTSIPVIKSRYELIHPTFFEYQRLFQGYVALTTGNVESKNLPISGGGSISHQIHNYVAENVPAFKNEPYMTTRENYLSKISFELRRTSIPGQTSKQFLPSSYFAIARTYYEGESGADEVKNANYAADVIEEIKSRNSEDLAIAQEIYYYVRDNFKEDNEVDYPTLRKVFKEQIGSSRQINKLLVAMLNEAGLDANIVFLSTRNNGRIRKDIPLLRMLNFTIGYLSIGEKTYLLDATEEAIPFNVLPKYCLNGDGLLISNNPKWIPLQPFADNSITYGGEFTLEDGYLVGNLIKRRAGYEAWNFIDKNEDLENYKEDFNERMDSWLISGHEVGTLEDKYKIDEEIEVELEGKVDDLGDILYLNPVLHGRVESNPLRADSRKFPVNFAYPNSETHYYKIKLDDSYTVVELPEPAALAIPNNGGVFRYAVTNNNNEITLTCQIEFSRSEYYAEEYPYLREFFTQLIEKQGEQIVLRRN